MSAGAVRAPDAKQGRKVLVQAQGRDHLRELLRGDQRYVFTLIQKFSTEVKGTTYPTLSTRDDVVVMADEAHRSQYDTFASNMRDALPNARYLAFTGTPLVDVDRAHGPSKSADGETKVKFGDYLSIYPFEEAIADEATVPLYYENRLPRIELADAELGERVYKMLEAATLDPDEARVLRRELAKLYSLITDDARLDEVARDLVEHYTSRTSRGKAMVVSIDRFTAVEMSVRVKRHWDARLVALEAEHAALPEGSTRRDDLAELIAWMRATEMAPVISESQGEVDDFKNHKVTTTNLQGFPLDIVPIRKRINEPPALDACFKDPKHPLRIVFVCGMWMTGFDVPSCDVIYLDKPMRNHTLMQTIARANRVDAGKACGMIVDYAGVFHDLRSALSIYANRPGAPAGATPVQPRKALIAALARSIDAAETMVRDAGVDPREPPNVSLADRLALRNAAKEALIHPDDRRRNFLAQVNLVDRIFSAMVLDDVVKPFALRHGFLTDVAGYIRATIDRPDVSEYVDRVRAMLAESVVVHRVTEGWSPGYERAPLDLRRLDVDGLANAIAQQQKTPNASAMSLQTVVRRALNNLLQANPTRDELQARFEALVARYNEGIDNAEAFFAELVKLLGTLKTESTRAEREGLSEHELAFRDVLARAVGDAPKEALTAVAKALPGEVAKVMSLDWKLHQQLRDKVRARVKRALGGLPEDVSDEAYARGVEAVFQWLLLVKTPVTE